MTSSFGNRYPNMVAGPGKGRIGTTGRPENANAPISSGKLWLDSFGNGRYNLGPMISSPGNVWNDLDLFQITAANQMVISNVFVWKMIATSAINSITTILAPKIAIPNNVYTFSGKTMYYNIQPANEVPKRGTVRTMTKSYEEFKVHLSQKGMGSRVEGGTFRTPIGAQFLDQEIVAIAWSLELNIALNTVTTVVNAAIASAFNFNRVTDPQLNAVTYAYQIDREIKAFCIGAGSNNTLVTQITSYLQAVPTADVIYMSKRLETNLTFNTEAAGKDLPHKSYAMIPDENGVNVPVTIRGVNGTRTAKTIFGSLSVLTMPTFNFRNGEIKYNPLEHEFTSGNHWILNAESGYTTWDKLVVPTTDSKRYTTEMLNALIYSHDIDKRDNVTFVGSMKHAHIFGSDAAVYHFVDGSKIGAALEPDYKKKICSGYLLDYVNDLNSTPRNDVVTAIKDSKKYLVSLNDIASSVNEPPTYIQSGQAPVTINNFFKAVQSFKGNVQYPLSRNLKIDVATGSINQTDFDNFYLPTYYGDLDAFHLMGISFKSMISDIKSKREIMTLFYSDQYQAFCELKKTLNKPGPINHDYWNLVSIMNRKLLESGDSTSSYFGLSTYVVGGPPALAGWRVQRETNFMIVPSVADYNAYLVSIGKENFAISPEEYIPPGLWSVAGLKLLSNQLFINQTRLSKMAGDALSFLGELTKVISDIFPYSSICNGRDFIKTVSRFLDPNTIIAEHDYNVERAYNDAKNSGAISDIELTQIIFSLLDDPTDRMAVVLSPFPLTDSNTVDTKNSIFNIGKNIADASSYVVGKEALSYANDLYLVREFKVQVANDGSVNLTIPDNYAPLPVAPNAGRKITIKTPKSPDESPMNTDEVIKFMVAGNATSPIGKVLKVLRFAIHKLAANYLGAGNTTFKGLFGESWDSISKSPALVDIADVSSTPTTVAVVNGVTGQLRYLTPFVLSRKSTTIEPYRSGTSISLRSMDTALTEIKDSASSAQSEKSIKDRYTKRRGFFSDTNGWMNLRWQEFVLKNSPGSSKSWNSMDRLLSAFLLETQLSQCSVERMISEGVRPPFEICLWRLFQRQRFEGLLIAKAGISTAMNPYNNPHINMGTDATTDQYTLRAVLQTDCVVVNPHNLIFVPCVSPTRYLGGRNTKFISSSDDVLDTTLSSEKVPSMISSAVSYGYMASTDDPISFINAPPGRIVNGSVMDVSLDSQMWPGASYYGKMIYGALFGKADTSFPQGFKLGSGNENAQRFQEWRRAQMDANHISTRGFKKTFDQYSGNYTITEQGRGHYAYHFMNDTGAKRVFEGIDSVFPVYVRAPDTNT